MDLAIFSSISDYRVTGRCKYRLDDLLLVAVLTHLCGGGTPSDMHIFAATRAHEFGLGCFLKRMAHHRPTPLSV